jgi:endoglucanase
MAELKLRRRLTCAFVGVACAALMPAVASAHHHAPPSRDLSPHARLFVPPPDPDGVRQVADLLRHHQFADAARVARMITTPQAVWFTKGTPTEVERGVRKTMLQAAFQRAVPTLVLYYLPFRDCGQFSAGGAQTPEQYTAFVDAFAHGIGNRQAIVILEPDGLGLVPQTVTNGVPSCNVADGSAGGTTDLANTRFALLKNAVTRLEQQPATRVYLDGVHSAWLSVGEISARLVRAGVQQAQGFFTNLSNYRFTEQVGKYSEWISKCIAFANNPEEGGWRLGHYDYCASQYYSGAAPNDGQPGNAVDPGDFSTWHWSDLWFDQSLGTATPTTGYVIDTSRNGQGHWTPPAGVYPDAQDWCNPPGRGVGARPTVNTGTPLLEALLWVKTPGQSDGSCNRGLPSNTDPEWGGIVDPAAGAWFPQQALQLAQLANPPLLAH